MTTHQSSTASPLLMGRNPTTPIASVPVPTESEPVIHDLTLRITVGAEEEGSTLERDPRGQWIGGLRRLGVAKLRYLGNESLLDDAKLLISELVTNALRYGGGGEIGFRLIVTVRRVVIAVNDGSPVTPRLSVVGADEQSGRGLLLVASLADDWGVSLDSTTTWCALNLRGASS
ncbi:ATP-binding protein [Streptomyces griseofuscus]|uniref:ATP-binding protein n=1 Tax=Streptomyces griseofuscus TaxID=146922 RepID=UPI0033CCF8F6